MSGENLDEEFVPEEEAENPAILVKRLREKLQKAETERQEYLDGWQRSKADFVNFRKEEEARRSFTSDRLKASLTEELIPVMDSFEMALKSPSFKEGSAEWQKGIGSLYSQLVSSLKRFGIEQYGESEVGKPFDPRRHEILFEKPVGSEAEDHTVVEVHAAGYTLPEYNIRPAKVAVGVFKQ